MNRQIIHDVAHATALQLLTMVCNYLREEECRDTFNQFYKIVKVGLEDYANKNARLHAQLHPMDGIRDIGIACENTPSVVPILSDQ